MCPTGVGQGGEVFWEAGHDSAQTKPILPQTLDIPVRDLLFTI